MGISVFCVGVYVCVWQRYLLFSPPSLNANIYKSIFYSKMPLVLLPCCLIFFSLSSRNGSQSSAKTFPTFISCFSRFLPILQSFGTYRIVFTCWFCSNFTQQLFTLIDGAPFASSYRTKLCFSSLGLVNGVFFSCFFFLHSICWWNVLLDVLFFCLLVSFFFSCMQR